MESFNNIISNNSIKPNISKIAFWDVNFDNIDFQENSVFVMNKVFNYGTWDDIIETLRFYGIERVRKEVIKSSYFKNTTLSFLCVILHLTEQDFVSYQQRQKWTSTWNY
jgi:hypothetical protein